MWNVLGKLAVAAFAVAVGIFIWGVAGHDVGIYDILVWFIPGLLALAVFGLACEGLVRLAFALDGLSQRAFNRFMAIWIVGWLVAGNVAMFLVNDDTVAQGCQIAGVLLAFSIPAIRLLTPIKPDSRTSRSNVHPIGGYGPEVGK